PPGAGPLGSALPRRVGVARRRRPREGQGRVRGIAAERSGIGGDAPPSGRRRDADGQPRGRRAPAREGGRGRPRLHGRALRARTGAGRGGAKRRRGEAAGGLPPSQEPGGREAWKSAPPGAVDPSHLEDWTSFATYLLGEKRPREALVALERAAKAAPANAEVLVLTAAAHTETGDVDRALAAYAEAEQLAPT